MKIRRIILLVLLAAGSVFLLSSCDAMLDAIFGQNTITVYASAPITYYGHFPSTDSVTVVVTGPTPANATANYDGYDGLFMYWSIEIPKLAEGSYSVLAVYHHPLGAHTGNWGLTYPVTFPATSGSAHSVTLDFPF